MKKIRDLFSKLGADYTGVITYSMLEEAFGTHAVSEYFESLGLDVSDAWSFFKLLDADGGILAYIKFAVFVGSFLNAVRKIVFQVCLESRVLGILVIFFLMEISNR